MASTDYIEYISNNLNILRGDVLRTANAKALDQNIDLCLHPTVGEADETVNFPEQESRSSGEQMGEMGRWGDSPGGLVWEGIGEKRGGRSEGDNNSWCGGCVNKSV